MVKKSYVDENLATAINNSASLVGPVTPIKENSDLNANDFLLIGTYGCVSSTKAQTLVNSPTAEAFMMETYSPLSTTGQSYLVRKILTFKGKQYVQRLYKLSTDAA